MSVFSIPVYSVKVSKQLLGDLVRWKFIIQTCEEKIVCAFSDSADEFFRSIKDLNFSLSVNLLNDSQEYCFVRTSVPYAFCKENGSEIELHGITDDSLFLEKFIRAFDDFDNVFYFNSSQHAIIAQILFDPSDAKKFLTFGLRLFGLYPVVDFSYGESFKNLYKGKGIQINNFNKNFVQDLIQKWQNLPY